MLTYHSIGQIGTDYPFDVGVVDASAELFDRQMAYIARFFTAITTDELRAARAGAPLPSNPIAITFDDGYRTNLHVVVPILKRHALRAIFFIATSFVDERRPFWWDRISYLIKKSPRDELVLGYPRPLTLRLGADGRGAAIEHLLRVVKKTYGLDTERLLDELSAAAGVPWDRATEKTIADELLLTWDEVRALRAAGMDVQSHTCTHRVLSTLAPDAARRELLDSRLTLERELGTPVRAVSYPCGHSIAREPALCEAVRNAGYELGFASQGRTSSVRDWRVDPLDLHRLLTGYDMPMSWFRGMLAFPALVEG
jgi:peptidoglycan/xylan/chitin deacetylase (PgdA/CDA1 family)